VKPFNTGELHVRIASLLKQRRLLYGKQIRPLPHTDTDLPAEQSLADRSFLTRLNDVVYGMMGSSDLSSDMVAEKMYLSRSQLNRKVKALTGFSTSDYIRQMRLNKAKRMIASTEIPIGDIAAQCGLPDMSYFSRIFKQAFRTTPTQYRKNCTS